jgi:protease IV
LEQSIAAAAKLANLGDKWQVQEFPEVQTLEERFLRSVFGNSHVQSFFQAQEQPQDVFTSEFKNLQADFQSLRSLNDPRGIYMRMPENLRIK